MKTHGELFSGIGGFGLGGQPQYLSMASGKDITGTIMANYGDKWGLGNQEAFSGEYHVLDDQGGSQMSISKDVVPTLRASVHGHQPLISQTLTGGSGKRGYVDPVNTTLTSSSIGIRRLTPLECERLQGFPDGWTDGQSDSARYKQLGNAVAVPVVKWIIERIINVKR